MRVWKRDPKCEGLATVLTALFEKTHRLPGYETGRVVLQREVRCCVGKAGILGCHTTAQFMRGADAFDRAKPVHALGCWVIRQAAVADFAEGVEQGQVGRRRETVVLADQTGMVAGFLPDAKGVACVRRHERLVAAAAVAVRPLAGPK